MSDPQNKPIINRDVLKQNLKWIIIIVVGVIVLWLKSLFVTKIEAEAHNDELEKMKIEFIIMKETVKNHTKILDEITEIKIKK